MNNIKNSPISPAVSEFEGYNVSPPMTLELEHPNQIGELTPWETDFRQLEPGRLKTIISTRGSETMSVMSIFASHGIHQCGASPTGWTTLGMPKLATVPTWQGKDIPGESFLSFGDSDGFDGITTSKFEGNVVSFDTRKFERLARNCRFDLSSNRPAARFMVSGQSLVVMKKLEHLVSGLLSENGLPWSPESEETLLLLALSILTSSDIHQDKSRTKARRKSRLRAIDLMQASLEDTISIEEICKQSGASWRTLDRAFHEYFGIGPKSYYIRLRLNRVREALLKGSQEPTIIDVANRYGFWHMGQFARDYRKLFAELPSQTRSRKSSVV